MDRHSCPQDTKNVVCCFWIGAHAVWGMATNQAQLTIVIQTCIEDAGGHVKAQPSLYSEQKAVEIKPGLPGPDWKRVAAFQTETGWTPIRSATDAANHGFAQPIQLGAPTGDKRIREGRLFFLSVV